MQRQVDMCQINGFEHVAKTRRLSSRGRWVAVHNGRAATGEGERLEGAGATDCH